MREPFRAERLSTLRAHFDGDVLPSQHLALLRRLIATRDILRNELARPFGLLLFVRSQAAVAIDRWHQAGSSIREILKTRNRNSQSGDPNHQHHIPTLRFPLLVFQAEESLCPGALSQQGPIHKDRQG